MYNTLFNIEKKWEKVTEEQINDIAKVNTGSITNDFEAQNMGIPVGELLFFSAYLRKYYLGELIAIKSENGAWIELNSVFEQLNFAITVNNESLTAKGWFISPNNQFEMNLNEQKVFVNGVTYSLNEQDYYIDAGDIFIDYEQLNAWFALKLKLDFNSLELYLDPQVKLPIEQKLQREQRKFNASLDHLVPTLPWKASPYQASSNPVADLQLSYSATKNNTSLNYSILGSQDLAYVNAEYYLAGREGNLISDSRLSFSRQDTHASLLGPLGATNVQFGDVLATQIGSNFSSSYARGIKINNKPLYKKVNSNQINLTGAVQAGWDVELYRNKILIDQQLSLPDGRYLFENIDLLFGANTFELIFYGPQGQVERKVEEYLVDGNSLEEGEGFYEVSLTQEGEQLLNHSTPVNAQDGWLLSGRYERGITDNLSVYSGLSTLSSDDGDDEHRYALGSNLSIFNKVLVNFDYEQNNNREDELEIAVRSELAEQSVRFSMRKASQLLNKNLKNGPLDDSSTYELFVSGNVMQNEYGRLSYQNTASHITNDTQDSVLRLGNILNYSIAGYSFNNSLQWADNDRFFGSSLLQKRFGRISTRLGVNYSLEPEGEITSYETEFSRSLSPNLQAELKLTHQLDDNIKYAELGLNWQAKLFSINSNFNYDSEDNWRVGLFGRFSLGYDTVNNDYFLNRRSLVQAGSLMVHVYLDNNNNGIFDQDDENIEGVKVKGLQNYRTGLSDENGIALLSGMPANLTTDIVIDTDSLPDPFYIAATEGFSITPRAGFVEYMEIPLNNSSEIEGTVYKQTGDTSEIEPYATVKLLDKAGKEVAQTQAAYDGYYLFTDLRPGQYKAVIDDEFKERKSLKNTQQIQVDLSAKGDVLVGVDFTLKEKAQTQGYIANIGDFSSLAILKTYYQLIKKNVSGVVKQSPFYVKDTVLNRYVLALAYDKTESVMLKDACLNIAEKGLSCTVQAQRISH